MAAPSFDELVALGKAEALVTRPELSFREGDVALVQVDGGAVMAEAVLAEAARLFRATFLDGARGDALTTLGDDHWATPRNPAQHAIGQVTFTRSVNGPAGTIATGTVLATVRDATGKEVRFVTDADSVWALNEQGSKTVAAHAELTGTDGNVAASKITRIITTLFDTAFTVTNAALFAGGDVEESEDDYRARIRAIPKTLRRGTLDALEYGALQVTTVKRARAEEEVVADVKTGIVNVYVSDADGNGNTTMQGLVETELKKWRAAGEIVNVVVATLVSQALTLSISVRAGVTVDSAKVKAALVESSRKLRPGETWYLSARKAAVLAVDPNGILEVNETVPGGNVVATASQVIRTTTGVITVS